MFARVGGYVQGLCGRYRLHKLVSQHMHTSDLQTQIKIFYLKLSPTQKGSSSWKAPAHPNTDVVMFLCLL